MTPSSEDLEAFQERVAKASNALGLNHNFTKAEHNNILAELAREWLKLSSSLKESVEGLLPVLDKFDACMTDVLKATKGRTRASVFRKYLSPFKSQFLDELLVPLMRHEGSPSQSAARQLEGVFEGMISSEEGQYIGEAARCSASRCNRAAIVMLWAAAIARLHAEVQNVGFVSYNAALAESTKKKGHPYSRVQNANVTSLADLQLRSDFDLLVIGMALWNYDSQTFEELNRCLNIRNSAAHPGSFEPSSLDVRQFAEKVKRYVFSLIGKPKFS